MRKVLLGLVAGQAFQLLLHWVTVRITYTDQAWGICLGIGILVLGFFCWGAWPQLMYAPGADVDIEEAPPLPEDLKVTQTNVERTPKKHKSWGARIADAIEADRKADGKHEEPSVMEKKLAEVGNDV